MVHVQIANAVHLQTFPVQLKSALLLLAAVGLWLGGGCATTQPQTRAPTPNAPSPEPETPPEIQSRPFVEQVYKEPERRGAPFDVSDAATLTIMVVDVGQGLCTLIFTPSRELIVYDTGLNARCAKAARKLVGNDVPDVSLLVLSHEDTDHIGGLAGFFRSFVNIHRILRTGYDRSDETVKTWWRNQELLENYVGDDINLARRRVKPGTTYTFGSINETRVTFVAGWSSPPASWPVDGKGERRNAGSIVIRVEFDGKSILLAGDTIGRPRSDRPRYADACESAEAAMVARSAQVPIASDVLVAPHHGSNNGSSTCFIEAVSPTYVIFSAGRRHCHPKQSTVDRYLAAGVKVSNLRRTDTGDKENEKPRCHESEWGRGSGDKVGDDDVFVYFQEGIPSPVIVGGKD